MSRSVVTRSIPLEPASELGALEDDDGDAGGGERSEHLRRRGFDEEGANGGANPASRLARVVALARGSVHPPLSVTLPPLGDES